MDECAGPGVAHWLREGGHDVVSVYESARGASDGQVLYMAVAERRILITNDRDFGDKVYRERHPHCGIVFLRLDDERTATKIAVIEKLLRTHLDRLEDMFVVATEKHVRFGQ